MAASGGGGSLSIVSAGEDEGVWDSMAVMAAESWNKGSVDELGSMTREDLLPQRYALLLFNLIKVRISFFRNWHIF